MLSRANLAQNHCAINGELIDHIISVVFHSSLPAEVASRIRVLVWGLDTIIFVPEIVALLVLRMGADDFCLATPAVAWDAARSEIFGHVERVLSLDFVEAVRS